MGIAQTEGERAVTMRAAAEACGVTPMALYHHVENKEALLTALVDRVVPAAIDEVGEAAVGLARRPSGRRAMTGCPRVYLRRPVISPAMAQFTELMFEAFELGGLEGDQLAEATDATVLLVMGSIANDLTRPDEVRYQLADELEADEGRRLRSAIDAYSRRNGEHSFHRPAHSWVVGNRP